MVTATMMVVDRPWAVIALGGAILLATGRVLSEGYPTPGAATEIRRDGDDDIRQGEGTRGSRLDKVTEIHFVAAVTVPSLSHIQQAKESWLIRILRSNPTPCPIISRMDRQGAFSRHRVDLNQFWKRSAFPEPGCL